MLSISTAFASSKGSGQRVSKPKNKKKKRKRPKSEDSQAPTRVKQEHDVHNTPRYRHTDTLKPRAHPKDDHEDKSETSAFRSLFNQHYDPQFVEIDLDTATKASVFYDRHAVVNTCERIRLRHLVAGGIVISRKGKAMNEFGKRFFDNVYVNFVRDLAKSWSRYGFAVVQIKPHDVFIGVPVVLEMQLLRIRMHTAYDGERSWKVYMREDRIMGVRERRIYDFTIFEYEAPTIFGDCQSELMRLGEDIVYFSQLREIHYNASSRAANPLVFLQQRESKQVDGTPSYGNSIRYAPATAIGEDFDTPHTVLQTSQMASYSAMAKAVALARNMGTALPNASQLCQIPGHPVETYRLDTSQEVANGPSAQDFTDIEVARVALEERIAGVMGVPRPMFASSGYSQRAEHKEITQEFRDHQIYLKRELIRVLYEVYYSIYREHHIAEAIACLKDTPFATDVSRIKEDSTVTIDLPGVADTTVMQELYEKGVLEYEAYKQHLAHTHFLPLESFAKTPHLSLKDVNGIKPETTSSSSSSKKKSSSSAKTKKKPKKSSAASSVKKK